MLDLRRLGLLRELDARGTIHGAARALDYTPSAISQQLAVLEREAGVALLERAGRNVRLTQAGQVLVRHAASLLDGVEAAEAELADLAAGQVAGVVRVAAFQSAFLRIVAPAVAALGRSHPDVRVGDVDEGRPRAIHADVDRERLLREQVRLVLPAGHPEAAHERVAMRRLAGAGWSACQ